MAETKSPTLLGPEQYVQAVQRDGAAMHELLVADPGCLSAEVPPCPGWDVAKLVSHLGRVFCSIREHIVRRAQAMVPADEIPHPPEGAAIVGWFAEMHAQLVQAVAEVDPQEPLWSWAGPQYGNGAFYKRRMAHETLIHRWDLEAALGTPVPLPAELALDNVDELLGAVLPFTMANWERSAPAGSMHLHATDLEAGEWLLTPDGSGGYSVAYEHAKGEVAVRADAEALALFMWERVPLRELQADGRAEVFGEVELAEQWAQLSR